MKIQKQLSKRVGEKVYYKYAVVLPEKLIEESGIKVGEELKGEVKNGSIVLKK